MKAKYTVVLKTIMDIPEGMEKINQALSKYPLYEPVKKYDIIPDRAELNRRLLNHYKYREIGFETVGMFLDELEITMGEIMPHYNELLKTVETMAELPSPFDNVDVVETFDEKRTDKGSSDTASGTETTTKTKDTATTTNTAESSGKSVRATEPQDLLSIPVTGVDSVNYANEASWDKNKSTATGTTTSDGDTTATSETAAVTQNESTGTTTHTYTKKGNQGVNTYAHDMNEFRTSIIDVVNQIINDSRIAELFMLIY